MVGSVRNSSSKPEFEPFVTVGLVPVSEFAQSDFNETVLVGRAEFGINPSCRHLRHHDSKSAGGALTGLTRSLPLAVLTAGGAAEGATGAAVVEAMFGAPASCGRFAGI